MNTCCAPTARTNSCNTTSAHPSSIIAEKFYRPTIDVIETGPEFTITADVPAAAADSIDLSIENGVLTVTAQVKPRDRSGATALRREYAVGSYRRSFQLGDAIDTSAITAELTDGVLTIHLPKSTAQRARKIEVRHN